MEAPSEVGGDEVRYLETIPTISTAAPQKADGHDDHNVCWWDGSNPNFCHQNSRILTFCLLALMIYSQGPLFTRSAVTALQYFTRLLVIRVEIY